jgi:peptidoglycan hydrolase-like protein with peptidoglycan-binding domain
MNSGPTLSQGSTGADVKRLQRLFVMMKTAPVEAIDGSFGAKTKAAVIDFQQGSSLPADGIVGPNTWAKLPADPDTPLLKKNATGAAVTGLQKGLLKFGGAGSATDPGAADGKFGAKTQTAVKAYQTQQSLAADGVVGDRTWWTPAGAAGATLASLSGLTTV